MPENKVETLFSQFQTNKLKAIKKNQINVLLKLHSNNAMQSNKEHIVWTASKKTLPRTRLQCKATKKHKENHEKFVICIFCLISESLLFLLYFFAVEYDK